MKRLLIALVVAVVAGASCVRHVELTPVRDAETDAAFTVDASIDGPPVDASFTASDAPPDSAVDAL